METLDHVERITKSCFLKRDWEEKINRNFKKKREELGYPIVVERNEHTSKKRIVEES